MDTMQQQQQVGFQQNIFFSRSNTMFFPPVNDSYAIYSTVWLLLFVSL